MYVPDERQFGKIDLTRLDNFVEYWLKLYSDPPDYLGRPGTPIDYEKEIKFGQDLDRSNLINLMRWKDPVRLTHSTKEPNQSVLKILKKRRHINQFRNQEIGETEIKRHLAEIFSTGIVWRGFLLHVCRPLEYPIVDRHVFRVHKYQTGKELGKSWKDYDAYKTYFHRLARGLPKRRRNIDKLSELKRLDSALMMFGRFLGAYEQKGKPPPDSIHRSANSK